MTSARSYWAPDMMNKISETSFGGEFMRICTCCCESYVHQLHVSCDTFFA